MFSINFKERNGKTPTTLPVAAVIIVSNNRIKHIGSSDGSPSGDRIFEPVYRASESAIDTGSSGGKLKKTFTNDDPPRFQDLGRAVKSPRDTGVPVVGRMHGYNGRSAHIAAERPSPSLGP
jgi:hypothetical protein